MARVHGERPKDYAQRRAMELEREQATSKYLKDGIRRMVEIPMACRCRKWPFPHHHAEKLQDWK